MAKDKPLSSEIVDRYAHNAPKIQDPSSKPRILDLTVVDHNTENDKTVDPSTREVRRMFSSPEQAFQAYRRLKQQNVERNRRNQLIQKKLNNETPYKPKYLSSLGQDWRSNRPTGFISTMVSRIQPPFRQVIEDASTLTYSSYPVSSPNSEHITKVFREEVTRCIRDWGGWNDLIAQTTHENTVFGYCNWMWDDLRDWKPEFCRQDYTFFSIETPQENNATPIWARKKRYQIADLLPILEKPYLSMAAGWNIKNLIKAINNAIPAGRTLDSDDDARRYEDWIREGSYGASYENDAKYVELGMIFVKEPNGKISRFLFDDKSGDEICTQLDRFNNMSECVNLFAVEVGSGSLMSSRGAGRDLYNTHVAADKARNLIVDNTYLAGLLILKKTPAAKPGIAPLTVEHPIAYISEGYDVQTAAIPANVDNFLKLDQFISGLSEIQVGTYLPGAATGLKQSKKTASEVNRVAAIENQLRQGILMRWSRQLAQGINRIQRGICHPEHVQAADDINKLIELAKKNGVNNAVWARREVVDAFDRSFMELPKFMIPFEVPSHLDEDAIAACLNMIHRGLDPADILLTAYSSSNEVLPDKSQQEAQAADMIIQRYRGNPNVDQDKLVHMDISKKLGEEVAKDIILPKKSVEANEVEAAREQILELQAIIAGQEIPVSPRDNDIVHLQVMTQKLLPVIQAAPAGGLPPEGAKPLAAAMGHYIAHIQAAEQKGGDKKLLAQYKKAAQEAHKHLTAGHGTEPHPDLFPAAAAKGGAKAPRGGGGAGRSGPAAPQPSEPNSQDAKIDEIANPPKPPTGA
jgi:hypothetical protein